MSDSVCVCLYQVADVPKSPPTDAGCIRDTFTSHVIDWAQNGSKIICFFFFHFEGLLVALLLETWNIQNQSIISGVFLRELQICSWLKDLLCVCVHVSQSCSGSRRYLRLNTPHLWLQDFSECWWLFLSPTASPDQEPPALCQPPARCRGATGAPLSGVSGDHVRGRWSCCLHPGLSGTGQPAGGPLCQPDQGQITR